MELPPLKCLEGFAFREGRQGALKQAVKKLGPLAERWDQFVAHSPLEKAENRH